MPVAITESSVPGQIVSCVGVIVSVGVTKDVTVMVMEFDEAVVGEAQASDDVRMQLTTSPLANDEVLNGLPAPTLVPFTSH